MTTSAYQPPQARFANADLARGGFCGRRCPAGRKCVCNPLPHALHICGDPHCMCHSRERYEARRTAQEAVVAEPAAGARKI